MGPYGSMRSDEKIYLFFIILYHVFFLFPLYCRGRDKPDRDWRTMGQGSHDPVCRRGQVSIYRETGWRRAPITV